MKVKLLNIDRNPMIGGYFTIGKIYKVSKEIKNCFLIMDDYGEKLWHIRKESFKVTKKRKVYLKKVKDYKIINNDCICDHCHLDTYNENELKNCGYYMEKYNLGNCVENDTHFKLMKIEVIK